MPISERAKQFMPFASLRGFGKVIKKEEKIKTEMPQLSEDEIEKLNETAKTLKKGDIVSVRFHDGEFITEIEGAITEYNPSMHFLKIIKTLIPFTSVLKITRMDEES